MGTGCSIKTQGEKDFCCSQGVEEETFISLPGKQGSVPAGVALAHAGPALGPSGNEASLDNYQPSQKQLRNKWMTLKSA